MSVHPVGKVRLEMLHGFAGERSRSGVSHRDDNEQFDELGAIGFALANSASYERSSSGKGSS